MTRITVIGGTGYAGAALVREAAARGHEVRSFSRSLPETPLPGVRYEQGSVLNEEDLARAVADADVVISAMSPRGDMAGRLVEGNRRLTEVAGAAGVRLGVIGGFSSLRATPGAPRFAAGDDLPPEYAAEGKEMAAVADTLEASGGTADWFYAIPAMEFGAHVPGQTVGTFRIGGDVPLFDAEGRSALSGTDFATAVVDEIENPKHHRAAFSVAY